MEIKKYGMEELNRAREVQQECLDLHLPPPPVVWWEAKIIDVNGEVIEHIQAKANSYVRNAINILAVHVGMCSKSILATSNFGDGIVNVKLPNGSIYALQAVICRRIDQDATVLIGMSNSAESLDSYVLPATTETWNATSSTAVSIFNTTSKKLITTLSRAFTNVSGSSKSIVESGIQMINNDGGQVLMVRDVFPSIAVANGQTITWTYTTEVAYPNP